MLTSLSPAYCGDQSYELQESKDYIMLTICEPVVQCLASGKVLKIFIESMYLSIYTNIML